MVLESYDVCVESFVKSARCAVSCSVLRGAACHAVVLGDIFLSSDEGLYPFCAMLCMTDKRLVRGSEARPILTVYLKKLDNQPETFQQNVIERERFRSLR